MMDRLTLVTVSLVREVSDGQLGSIHSKHPDLFKDGDGKLEGVQAKDHVDGDKALMFFIPGSVPYAMKTKVEDQLQRVLERRCN